MDCRSSSDRTGSPTPRMSSLRITRSSTAAATPGGCRVTRFRLPRVSSPSVTCSMRSLRVDRTRSRSRSNNPCRSLNGAWRSLRPGLAGPLRRTGQGPARALWRARGSGPARGAEPVRASLFLGGARHAHVLMEPDLGGSPEVCGWSGSENDGRRHFGEIANAAECASSCGRAWRARRGRPCPIG